MKASLSLDLDNLWSYQKTHGDPDWTSYPSYLSRVIPHLLDLADDHSVSMTVFIVGQDAAFDENVELLKSIGAAGHEIGNHSFRHEPWLPSYRHDELVAELHNAHASIAEATGREPVGYRGPGFSHSATVIETLAGLGYAYDASTLPTWIGPLARRYYFRSSDLTDEERRDRASLFGSWRDVLRPNTAYRWQLASGALAELPVTTMPLIRTPIHVSYLLYLSRFSMLAAELYLRVAMGACRIRGQGPSMLLHPLDLLGGDDVTALEFFPGMDMPGAQKRSRTSRFVELLAEGFELSTCRDHLASLEPLAGHRPP